MTVPYSPPPPAPRKKNTVWWLLGGVITLVLLLVAAAAVFLVVQRDNSSAALSDGEESGDEPAELIRIDEVPCPKIDWTALSDFYPSDDEEWLEEVTDEDNDSMDGKEGFGTQWCEADIDPRAEEIDSVAFSLELVAHDDPEKAADRHETRTDIDNDLLRDEIEVDEINIVDECDEAASRTELDTDDLAVRDLIAGCRVGNLNIFVIIDNYLADADADVAPDETVTEVAAPITSEALRVLTD